MVAGVERCGFDAVWTHEEVVLEREGAHLIHR